MTTNCPSCTRVIEQFRPPARNDPNAGDAWVCNLCPTVVCTGCYVQHNERVHPELYALPPNDPANELMKQRSSG